MTGRRRADLGRRYWRAFAGSAFAAVGVIATAAGLYDVLFPDVLPELGASGAGAVLVVALVSGLWVARARPLQESYATPNVTIQVVSGDLFDQPGHLVIGMTDTFDTEPGIIATASVQAQFLQHVYNGDVARLDSDLAHELSGTVQVGPIAKSGKTVKYAIGTVATLRAGTRRFFCFALSEMNDRNEARATIDGVWTGLSSVWAAVCAHSNGEPVAMTVIGGGQSRLSQSLSAADAIRLQALSFWLACRRERVCSELRIVVASEVYEALDRRELQAFLTSLRPS